MYTSKVNIKHNRSTQIHWGVHKVTNELIWIDDVEGNGFACNCKCAGCGADLKAITAGKIQQHHFKHRGNNGCYYSDEIAEYLKTKAFFSSFTSIKIPPLAVRIGSRPQIINESEEVTIDNVYCFHDANHYPPLLVANINDKPTRIILSFSGYYAKQDYQLLYDEARESNWDCLEIILPRKNDGIVVTKELLYDYVPGMNRNKRWIFNSQIHEYWVRLKLASNELAPMKVKYGTITDTEYACPLHKRVHNGKFYAFINDCKACEFLLGFSSEHCLCLSEASIKDLADLDVPEKTRKERFRALQQENEVKLQEQRFGGVSLNKRTLPAMGQNAETSHLEVLTPERAKESFCKQLCPCCGKQLFKNKGKNKINWLCRTHNCDFFVIEDMRTGEVKIMLNGKEI